MQERVKVVPPCRKTPVLGMDMLEDGNKLFFVTARKMDRPTDLPGLESLGYFLFKIDQVSRVHEEPS
jgi:hypothetical protein